MSMDASAKIVYGWDCSDNNVSKLIESLSDEKKEELTDKEFLIHCPYSGDNISLGITIAEVDSDDGLKVLNMDENLLQLYKEKAQKMFFEYFNCKAPIVPQLLLFSYYA